MLAEHCSVRLGCGADFRVSEQEERRRRVPDRAHGQRRRGVRARPLDVLRVLCSEVVEPLVQLHNVELHGPTNHDALAVLLLLPARLDGLHTTQNVFRTVPQPLTSRPLQRDLRIILYTSGWH